MNVQNKNIIKTKKRLDEISAFLLAYNEEQNIQKAIESLNSVLNGISKKYEILVVLYEGHTDNTGKIVQKIAKRNKKIRLIIQPVNKKGYGYALRIGINNSRYKYIFYSDADNQFDMNDIQRLLPYLDRYDIVSGYRTIRRDALARRFIAKVYNTMLNCLFLTYIRDIDSAFKIYNKRIFDSISIKSTTGIADAEILIKAKKLGFRLKEIPILHYERKMGKAIFEGNSWGLIRLTVIMELLKEMFKLWNNVYIKGNIKSKNDNKKRR